MVPSLQYSFTAPPLIQGVVDRLGRFRFARQDLQLCSKPGFMDAEQRLFAALNTAAGEVLSKAPRHTGEQFVAFLTDVVSSQPKHREIH